jgi:hypothetical protein
VKRHDLADEQDQGPISISIVQRGDGTVSGRTGGRDFNDGAARVQGKHAKTRTTTKDEYFPPLSEELSWTSCGQRGPNSEKRKYCSRKRPRLDNALAAAAIDANSVPVLNINGFSSLDNQMLSKKFPHSHGIDILLI